MIFLDPFAEIDMAAAGMDPAALAAGSGSNLEPLLGAWGIGFSATEVVADNRYALSISTGLGLRPVRHLALLGITDEAMDSEDVIIDGLGNLNMGSAGHFTVLEDSTAELQPLLTSSVEAALLPSIQVQMLADVDEPRYRPDQNRIQRNILAFISDDHRPGTQTGRSRHRTGRLAGQCLCGTISNRGADSKTGGAVR